MTCTQICAFSGELNYAASRPWLEDQTLAMAAARSHWKVPGDITQLHETNRRELKGKDKGREMKEMLIQLKGWF